LSAQYHGVSVVRTDLTSRIPVGKKKPISIPNGKIKRIDITILFNIADVIIFATTVISINRIRIIAKAVIIGNINIQGDRASGKYSLIRLPTPALMIIVKSKIPSAYTG